MKKQIRVVGFDDCPHKEHGRGRVKVIGTFFRGGLILDGVLSFSIKVDGDDSTKKLIKTINKSKFKPQIKAVFLDGIAFGGFNIIDIDRLYKKTGIPVIVVIRKKPDIAKIKKILKKLDMEEKIRIIDRAGKVVRAGKIYVQYKGLDFSEVKEILKVTCTNSYIPECIRVAHLIAQALFFGESKGDA